MQHENYEGGWIGRMRALKTEQRRLVPNAAAMALPTMPPPDTTTSYTLEAWNLTEPRHTNDVTRLLRKQNPFLQGGPKPQHGNKATIAAMTSEVTWPLP